MTLGEVGQLTRYQFEMLYGHLARQGKKRTKNTLDVGEALRMLKDKQE